MLLSLLVINELRKIKYYRGGKRRYDHSVTRLFEDDVVQCSSRVSSLFLIVALGMRLLISKATKDQLVAGQIAVIARVIAKEHPFEGDYEC